MLDTKESIRAFKAIWEFVSRNYYSSKGLVAQLLSATVGVFVALRWVLNTLLPAPTNPPAPILTMKRTVLLYAVIWTLVTVIVVILWLWKRMVPRFRRGKIGVLFTAESEPELKKELGGLAERLVGELKQKDLRSQIIVKSLPPNHKAQCHIEAMRLLSRARGRVLIWGRPSVPE